ncbi:MFS transporter [Pseudobacter ginsenosidimutans]|uniref:FHS family L-fucose permease-like MFS transporter n=1 Tax=Pseudobacter ginsenosidimutans TaxID=661488 RepID=A0A4Q7N3V8_9BACT|nr:MFS transporter [Pseudobacter ginsenosidimutans]QEC44201.1 sugar MFS transporter [Pseudobacter ginsenosidimutans]RZS75658.1 FHS family L-fucose permease-like MFS transporter [Pseudobacter ginsenosidimutans]
MSQPTKWSQFGVLITVFFFWGFVAASNSIFIPFCKEFFHLDQIQSQLIGSAFYGAYFYGSLILFIVSTVSGIDVLNKIGYKKGIIYGLLISVVGAIALAFISGSEAPTFAAVLIAFFIIALGFSLQQTAAQPFAIALGPVESGAHRLNMAGGVNSFGTLLGPLVVSWLLFGTVKEGESSPANISNIQTLYFFLSGLFILASLVFAVAKLPKTTSNETLEKSPKAMIALVIIGLLFPPVLFADQIHLQFGITKSTTIVTSLVLILLVLFVSMLLAARNKSGWGAMAYPQLVLGMIAIFVYVGVEVTVDNNFGALLKLQEFGGYDEAHISHLISLYWGSLMIGRWTGAVSVFNFSKGVKKVLGIVVPFAAFGIILLVNLIKGNKVDDFLLYPICIAIAVGAFLFANEKPVKLLLTVSVLGAIAMVIALTNTGMVANFAIISCGLCASVMWPCIFALAVSGLGKYTSQGSAFLIMMILGGAILPPAQGAIIDIDKVSPGSTVMGTSFTHFSYIVPLLCFAYLAWHTLKTKSVLKKQGLDVDAQVAAGH